MKILCMADIHGDTNAVIRAREFAENNDINSAIILGDFASYGTFNNPMLAVNETKEILGILSDLDLMAIPGNCDPREILDLLDCTGSNLHEKARYVRGVQFMGLGGSSPTPFNTPFEMSEDRIYEKIKNMIGAVDTDRLNSVGKETIVGAKTGSSDPAKTENFVLALHCPPRDTNCDMIGDGTHVGSTSVRKIAEKFQPDLLLCSHVHESGGNEDTIGKTRIANIGMLSEGRIGVIEREDNKICIKLTTM